MGKEPAKKARVPVKFSIRSYAEVNETLTTGQTLLVPAHWRMHTESGEVIASGPIHSEHVIVAMVRMMAEYTREHSTEAREIVKLALNANHGKQAQNVLQLPKTNGSAFRDLDKRIEEDDERHRLNTSEDK
jgi:hypothetical protein